jgi:hypothetical protein
LLPFLGEDASDVAPECFMFPFDKKNKKMLFHAGPMTAQDMTALFNPVPFGEVRVTVLQQVLTQSPQLWERLRNIDMDKEAAVLEVLCSLLLVSLLMCLSCS